MTACSSPSSIPAQFDAIERMSIQTVLVHDQRIAYLDVGAGPPVILIHGFGGSMWQWEQQQRTLSQHFRVLTLDLPGAGLSDKPEIGYRPDQMLDFFVAALPGALLVRRTDVRLRASFRAALPGRKIALLIAAAGVDRYRTTQKE